jgi:hypothetical protein
MARNAALLLAIIVLAYAAVCLVLFAAQRSMIYYPQPSTGEGPGNALKILRPRHQPCGDTAQNILLDLTGGGPRHIFNEFQALGKLLTCDAGLLQMTRELPQSDPGWRGDDEGANRFARPRMRHRHHGHFADAGVIDEYVLDFLRRDILAPADDQTNRFASASRNPEPREAARRNSVGPPRHAREPGTRHEC